MGPPSNHSRTGATPLSFDNAYNFHGTGGHVMSQPLQDFPVQLSQHHPFSLSHHDSPGPHSHGLRAGASRGGPGAPSTTLMYGIGGAMALYLGISLSMLFEIIEVEDALYKV